MKHTHTPLWLATALLAGACLASTTSPVVRPFSARSGDGKAMRFTRLSPEETGIHVDNKYDDPKMWAELYKEFQGGAIGTGVAIGDLDGDGLADIYVVNKTRPNQLFRQVSPFKFEDVSDKANAPGGPTWKTGVCLADVNNDGALDIYVCQFRGPNLLYLNDGKGHFHEGAKAAGIDLVSGSAQGSFADYDRDGFPDLFVVTNVSDARVSPDGEADHLYHNNGNGTFTEVTAAAGISDEKARGHSAVWFDFNHDGWDDLYIANDFNQPDHLYRNNGNGTFTDVTNQALSHIPWYSMGSDFGDINNDGLFDFIVADMAGTTHYKSKVTMGDMGGLVDYMDALETPQYMKNAVYLNSGADRFFEVGKLTGLSSSDWTWSLRFEDLDNDGWVDLHITNGMVRSFINSDLVDKSKRMESEQEIIQLMKNSPVLNETHLALRNDHNLKFKKVQADWGLDESSVAFGSALADLDGDGDLDIVYINFDGNLSVYRNDCPTGNSLEVALRGKASNRYGLGAQITLHTSQGTQVRELSSARGALSSSEFVAHFGLGQDAEAQSLEIRWPSGIVEKHEHVKAGARYTFAEPKERSKPSPALASRPVDHGVLQTVKDGAGLDFFNRERPFNDMVRQSLLPNRMNTLGGGMALADVNGDGVEDIVFAGAAGNPGALYLGSPSGHFTRVKEFQAWMANPECETMAPLLFDVDGDGDLDLLLTSGSVEAEPGSDYYRSHLYLNNGYGVFSESTAANALPSFSAAAAVAGDLDHDGDLDVFIGGRVMPGEYPSTPPSVLLENRNGVLVDVTAERAPALASVGMVTSALWTDVDSDGWLDLLVTGEWMGLRLFHNDHGKLVEATEEAGLSGTSGWWNSLVAADVNDDGAMDYVVGNNGLNTKYSADPKHPISIYYMDVEGKGRKEIVEAKFEGDRPIPVRGRSCSSRAMPSLRTKFPTYHAFGSALLPEIYSNEKLAGAFKVSATELATGVFLNDGKGHFKFSALPRLAQTAPVFGIAVQDFDGDGHLDLFLAQNFNGPQVETGRYNGSMSLLAKGDGKGGFTVLMPPQSGVLLPQESRGVLTPDLNGDGRPDVVVTRLQTTPAVFTSHLGASAGAWRIRLQGPKGNPLSAGARAIVHFSDGSRRLIEIASGSGYLCQAGNSFYVTATPERTVTKLEVIWPDGKRTEHTLDPKIHQVTLTP
ncbi:FG-GAP-like repeat-containing protein [Nibricoccus sp. IMCC34717]|uniref:FG-GAP-like repeat-containing protein n=1 Tax=Nibricoccus sp. IMCC34717 TaxID=3034021 RepID=UPI00384C8972